MKLPHQKQRQSPETVYAWYDRDLQRRKLFNKHIVEGAGRRYAKEDGGIWMVFPDGTHRFTYEFVKPEPPSTESLLLSDPRLDRESRIALEKGIHRIK